MCEAKRMGMSIGTCDVQNCSGNFCLKLNINLLEVKKANRRRYAFDRSQSGKPIVAKFYNRVEAAAKMKRG